MYFRQKLHLPMLIKNQENFEVLATKILIFWYWRKIYFPQLQFGISRQMTLSIFLTTSLLIIVIAISLRLEKKFYCAKLGF